MDSFSNKKKRGNSHQTNSNLGIIDQKEKDAKMEIICYRKSSARVTDYFICTRWGYKNTKIKLLDQAWENIGEISISRVEIKNIKRQDQNLKSKKKILKI